MEDLLRTYYVAYLNSAKPHVAPCPGTGIIVRSEIINDSHFDIQDLKTTIKQPLGTGSATYHNPENKKILFIDYEDFLNQLPPELIKGLKKCDFIVYDLEEKTFFLLNELSQSRSPENKRKDALQQLHNVVFNFSKVSELQSFIDGFGKKMCIFSNKAETLETPDNIADAFNKIKEYLPEPISIKFQPITKLNYELIETAIVEV